jgi:hypothetical protein
VTRTLLLCILAAAASCRAEDPYEHYVRTSEDFRHVRQDEATLRKAWPTFTYMPWTYQWRIGYTDASGEWSRAHGYNGAFVDREPPAGKLDWIDRHGLRFYVDHLAGKGALHLWDGDAVRPHFGELHGTGVRPRPLNEGLKAELKTLIARHVAANKGSPNRAAYALDDEISWGHFVHPTMWRITDDEATYPKWLAEVYGPEKAPRRERWISYDDIRPKLSQWTVADLDASPLLDQWTFNDATWSNFIGDLVEYANTLDPQTPAGFVGGQAPNAFGGYDYARLMRKVQFIEAYNLGSSQAIIRSFNPGNAIPAVTTHFHKGVADSVWQAWYYLAHGNRGFIGWVQDWFDKDGKPRPWHAQVGPALLEVEKLSPLLAGARWQHDGIAIYYSHASIQLGWVLDAQAHGRTWTNRNNDHRLGSSHLVRRAWENMLRDQGLQYDFLSYADVIQNGVPSVYRVLILPACLCLSDVEARRIRAFVEAGGTVVADYLPGVWDQHGKGRADGGVLDDLFGVRHEPGLTAKDLFNGRGDLWVETDQDANFTYKSYAELLTKRNSCVRDASGFNKAVRAADTQVVRNVGKGRAVLMNLSPQWYNAYRGAGPEAARHRDVFMRPLGVLPFMTVRGGPDSFGGDVTRWRAGDRTILFLTSNPEVAGSETGGGNAVGLRSDSAAVTLEFAQPIRGVRDERTGKPLPDGTRFPVTWKTNEAVVLSFTSPAESPGSSPKP